MPSVNDGCTLVNLDFAFEYLGTVYDKVSISTNGYICLGNNPACNKDIRPLPFDILVALNYDLDTTRNGSGQIYYKHLSSSDSSEFALAKLYVNLFNPIFMPKNIFMITYDEVMSQNTKLFPKVSFQVFLLTDSIKSYAVYKYKTCTTEFTFKATSGINHKHNVEKIIIENGQQCSSSNVGQSGLWVIEVTKSATGDYYSIFNLKFRIKFLALL
jgi:hypothetical protein